MPLQVLIAIRAIPSSAPPSWHPARSAIASATRALDKGSGYPMFTLERLVNVAEIPRIAGYDPYGYRGAHKQSIEMAIAYYACFAKGAGFSKIVTPDNSRLCPNASQYYGKLVNDVDRMVRSAPIAFPTMPRLPWSKPRQRKSTS
jgi:hypothetical protein